MKSHFPADCLAGACGILLLLSSLEHLTNPFRFLDGVLAYKLVSLHVARAVVLIVPSLSLIAALALMFPSLRSGALLLTALLGLVFVTVQATALIRNLSISCACFDPFHSETVSVKSLLLPAFLFLGAITCFALEQRRVRKVGPSVTAGTV